MRDITNGSLGGASPAPALRGAIGTVVEQMRAEQRWLGIMRLVVAASICAWTLFFLWTLPGSPFVDAVPGQESAGAVRFLLLAAGLFGSAAYLFVWRPSLRYESSLEFVRVLLGAGLLVRSPRQFKSRLAGECARGGKRGEESFSLLVVKLDPSAGQQPARAHGREFEERLAAIAIRSLARTGDVIGDAPPDEVWVLAVGANEDGRGRIETRMAAQLAQAEEALPVLASARIGGATFGPDGRKPRELFDNAYERLSPVASPAEQAAHAA